MKVLLFLLSVLLVGKVITFAEVIDAVTTRVFLLSEDHLIVIVGLST